MCIPQKEAYNSASFFQMFKQGKTTFITHEVIKSLGNSDTDKSEIVKNQRSFQRCTEVKTLSKKKKKITN